MSSRGMSQATVEMASGRPPETEDTLRGNQGSASPEIETPELTEDEKRVVADIVEPQADPRRQEIDRLQGQIEVLRTRINQIPEEINRLVKTRKQTKLLTDPDKETKAHLFNLEVEDQCAKLRAESESVLDKIHGLQGKIAEQETRIRLQPAAWWLQNEKRSLEAVGKVDLLLKTERRRVVSEIKVNDVVLKRQTKRVDELRNYISSLDSAAKWNAQHPDPLRPDIERNNTADRKMLCESLAAELPKHEGLTAREADLARRLKNVDMKLMQVDQTKTLIHVRALYVRYTKLAEELAPILLELRDVNERYAGHDFLEQIRGVCSFAEGHSVLNDVASLPKVFYHPDRPAGEEYGARIKSNYYYPPRNADEEEVSN